MRYSVFSTVPLRARIAVAFAVFLLAIVGGVSVYLLTSLGGSLQSEADETLILRASYVEAQILADQTSGLTQISAARVVDGLANLEEFTTPGIYVQIVDLQESTLAVSANTPKGSLPILSSVLPSRLTERGGFLDVPTGRDRLRVLVSPIQGPSGLLGYVIVAESMYLQDAALHNTQQFLLFAALGAALVALLGGWYLTGRALKPIISLTRIARRIAITGQFDQRLDTPTIRDEVGELAATFNDMISRLDDTFHRQRDFLADASHELRGPLMVIRGNLDLLKLDLSQEDRQDSAREAVEEVERMSRLVSDLLFLSEVDAQKNVAHSPVPLHDVVSSVFARASDLDCGVHDLKLLRNDPTVVLGDHQRLDQLLWNLVENAQRYTPAGGSIVLSLQRQGQIVELRVSDTGIGIPSEHLLHIFERFYRVDRARSRSQGGTGLGLAIVKQVAEAHGGRVRVQSSVGEGTTFAVVFPVVS